MKIILHFLGIIKPIRIETNTYLNQIIQKRNFNTLRAF